MKRSIANVLSAAGLDYHVSMTLLLRVWTIISGMITLILIPRALNQELQGYYYTYSSLLSIQIFFELGLSQVVISTISFETARNGKTLEIGERNARAQKSTLDGYVWLFHRWYKSASWWYFVVASAAGLLFIESTGYTAHPEHWRTIWVSTVLFTAGNLYVGLKLALIESRGEVGKVATVRIAQSAAGFLLLWAFLFRGMGLWAITAIPLASLCVSLVWLGKNGQFKPSNNGSKNQEVTWRRNIFPMQWRIALSWASGFFIFNLFTPATFAAYGPAEAGKLGISISVFNGVSAIGMSWAVAKYSEYAKLNALGESSTLNRLFTQVTKRCVAVTMLASAVVVGLAMVANVLNMEIVSRIVELRVLCWMAIGSTVNSYIFSAATFMRSHRTEPMLLQSIAGAILTAMLISYAAEISMEKLMLGNAAIITLVGLPWTQYTLTKFRNRQMLPSDQQLRFKRS